MSSSLGRCGDFILSLRTTSKQWNAKKVPTKTNKNSQVLPSLSPISNLDPLAPTSNKSKLLLRAQLIYSLHSTPGNAW
jgi:hypothetical protein